MISRIIGLIFTELWSCCRKCKSQCYGAVTFGFMVRGKFVTSDTQLPLCCQACVVASVCWLLELANRAPGSSCVTWI